MPGFTTPDGLIFEVPGDQPLISLTGGASGTFDILAEQVQALFTAQAATISALDARVTAAEAALAASRWRHIQEGTQSGGTSFDITVPAGFSRLRLTLVGDGTASPDQPINVRFNGDTSANYIRGFIAFEAERPNTNQTTPPDTQEVGFNSATTSIQVALWGTVEANKAVVDIEPTDGTQGVAVNAFSTRETALGGAAAGHELQFGWGKYSTAAVVSTVNVFTTGGNFAACRWYLEGYLLP